MKILVVDDDEPVRTGLADLIKKLTQVDFQLLLADGVESGLKEIRNHQPDIVFLDVEMKDGTGFDLLNALDEVHFQLVFVTAHNKYALDAFRFSAIDFLLKPVDESELRTALSRADQRITAKDIAGQLSILKSTMQKLNVNDQKIVLRDNKSLYFVKVMDIMHCEAQGSYTTFFLIDDSKVVVSKPLKEYEALLEPFGFLRTHHSHIVNTRRITRLDKADGGHIILDNGGMVPISQRKWEQVLTTLDK